jgi:hypothetical protein
MDETVGSARGISYLEQNVAALQAQLTPADRAVLDHIGADVAGTRYPADSMTGLNL